MFTDDSRPAAGYGSAPGLMVLTLILGLLLFIRVVAIVYATTDLHSDEALYWYWSRDFAAGYFSRPPIPIWLIGAATAICGDGEACIRLSSPVVATAGAFLIYALANHLYDRQVAFWAAIVYATLPAVSAFAMVAMPQVALALLWTAGLLALSIHLARPTLASGLLLGLAIGLGLLTDYTMIYLPACTALYLAATPKARAAMRAPATWWAVATAVVVAMPNLVWNAQNQFAAIRRANSLSDWTFKLLNPDETLVFVALQFVLFGPILLFVLLQSVLVRRAVAPRAPADRFLLFHSVPILALLLFQVLFFKARAHWAMPAFPAAAIFVTALLLRHGFHRVVTISIAIHVALLAGIVALSVFAHRFKDLPAFDRLIGWQQFAEELNRAAALSDIDTVVLRGRSTVSQAIYYLRDTPIEILAFRPRGRSPENEFEMHRSWAYGDSQTVLLATDADPSAFGIPLGTADQIGEFPVQPYLSEGGVFALYRVNPPAETDVPQ